MSFSSVSKNASSFRFFIWCNFRINGVRKLKFCERNKTEIQLQRSAYFDLLEQRRRDVGMHVEQTLHLGQLGQGADRLGQFARVVEQKLLAAV